MYSRPSVLRKLLSPNKIIEPIYEERQDKVNLDSYQPLIDLKNKRQLIEVSMRANGHPDIYQSMVVDIDIYSNTLFLDTLTPVNPYMPVKVGDTLLVSHHSNGEVLSFSGKLKAISHDRHALYALELPTDIGYTSRRFFPRWTPAPQHSILLRLNSPRGIPWSAKVLNLSAGGARIAVGGNLLDQLRRDTHFAKLSLRIARDFNMEASAQLKSYKYNRRPYEHTELSLSFRDLGFQQRLKLQNYICYQLETVEASYAAAKNQLALN